MMLVSSNTVFPSPGKQVRGDTLCLERNKDMSVQKDEVPCTSMNHELHIFESFILLISTLRITPVQQGLPKCSWLQGVAQGKQAENLQKVA